MKLVYQQIIITKYTLIMINDLVIIKKREQQCKYQIQSIRWFIQVFFEEIGISCDYYILNLFLVLQISMKNSELYDEIKRLVQQKHQIPPQSPSFAQRYVQQQLNKKKLTPFDPRQKMTLIMKKFQQLQTYVNVQDLLQCIKNRQKDIKVKKSMKQLTLNTIQYSHQPPEPIDQLRDNIRSLKIKIKENLGNLFAQKFSKENTQIQKFIDDFQMNKISNDQLKNCNSSSNMEQFLKKCTKQNKFENEQFDFQKFIQDKQNANINTINESDFSNQTKKLNLQQNKQYIELLHQISTYLQIILENQHKKKWMIRKSKRQSTVIGQGLRKTHRFVQQNKDLIQNNGKHALVKDNSKLNTQRINQQSKNQYNMQSDTQINEVSSEQQQRQSILDHKIHEKQIQKLQEKPLSKTIYRLKRFTCNANKANQSLSNTNRVSKRYKISTQRKQNSQVFRSKQGNKSKRNVNFNDTAEFKYQQLQTQQNRFLKMRKLTSINCNNEGNILKNIKSSEKILTQKQLVNENFTFRNRNIKQGLLRKLDNFLDLVDQEQKIFKQDNKNHLLNIQKLQTNLRAEYTKYRDDPLLDQQGFKAVRIRALQFK